MYRRFKIDATVSGCSIELPGINDSSQLAIGSSINLDIVLEPGVSSLDIVLEHSGTIKTIINSAHIVAYKTGAHRWEAYVVASDSDVYDIVKVVTANYTLTTYDKTLLIQGSSDIILTTPSEIPEGRSIIIKLDKAYTGIITLGSHNLKSPGYGYTFVYRNGDWINTESPQISQYHDNTAVIHGDSAVEKVIPPNKQFCVIKPSTAPCTIKIQDYADFNNRVLTLFVDTVGGTAANYIQLTTVSGSNLFLRGHDDIVPSHSVELYGPGPYRIYPDLDSLNRFIVQADADYAPIISADRIALSASTMLHAVPRVTNFFVTVDGGTSGDAHATMDLAEVLKGMGDFIDVNILFKGNTVKTDMAFWSRVAGGPVLVITQAGLYRIAFDQTVSENNLRLMSVPASYGNREGNTEKVVVPNTGATASAWDYDVPIGTRNAVIEIQAASKATDVNIYVEKDGDHVVADSYYEMSVIFNLIDHTDVTGNFNIYIVDGNSNTAIVSEAAAARNDGDLIEFKLRKKYNTWEAMV
jgi:hypothetical protein